MQKAVAITPFWIFSVSHMILSIAQACVIGTGCPLLCACLIMVNLIDHCPVDRCTVIVKKNAAVVLKRRSSSAHYHYKGIQSAFDTDLSFNIKNPAPAI